MDRRRVLADTSLFVQHLRARDKTATSLYHLTRRHQVETCAVVLAEILYGARSPEAEAQAWCAVRPYPIHSFTLEMAARQPALVRKLTRANRLPDIRDLMIAVTALELGLPIATFNRQHFQTIPEIVLLDVSQATHL